jgi:hypothetical protein
MSEDNATEMATAVADIAAQLGETKSYAIEQIERVVEELGVAAAYDFLAQTRLRLAEGGVTTQDGARPRTPGGTFFFIVRGRVTIEQHRAIWPDHRLPYRLLRQLPREQPTTEQPTGKRPATNRPPRTRLTWADAAELLPELKRKKGTVMSAKLTLIGRPGKVIDRGDVVATVMTVEKTPLLPKELPPPPEEPTVYLAFIAKKQWTKVAAALAEDESDRLVIEGYPALDKKLGVVGVLAQSVTTKRLQAAKWAKG